MHLVRLQDLLSSEAGSPAFEEFLDFLGERIKLKGWTFYKGGLDVKSEKQAEHF